jgi:hypothetical protein
MFVGISSAAFSQEGSGFSACTLSAAMDDALIRRIRQRACDPARRRGYVELPYGFGSLVVSGGSPEAVAFHRDAPAAPPYPALPGDEFPAVEGRLGFHIPAAARRLYTEVADGGFGPEYGILGLGKHGHRDSWGYNAVQRYRSMVKGQPSMVRGLPLVAMSDTGWTCGTWLLLVSEPGCPVGYWDPNATSTRGGLRLTVPTLREWWEHWLDDEKRLPALIEDGPWYRTSHAGDG